ncbi:fatty acyl-AMP ligase [Cryobacterium sp. TMT1-66-1]|uniref:fatty acyl-AMP ligase n=1 Tax=Cryobacterium sp. TMT1-66-1 TaxID=1259242 RepID=UPI002108369E|nr:fatty acyl-AMP ligase [Cryobacterium sp. TMT1-66-1]
MRRVAERPPDIGVRFHSSPNNSNLMSYRDLDRTARHDAVVLWNAGWRPGERVLLAFDAGLDFLRGLYAAFYAGLTVVPVPVPVSRNASAVRERILAIAKDSGSNLVLTTPQVLESIGGLDVKLSSLYLCDPVGEDYSADWFAPPTKPVDVAVIQYTSGSLGTPKGVIVSHSNLLANQRGIEYMAGFGAGTVLVGWLPHYHDMGLGLFMQSIFGGFALVITSPSQFLRRPLLWLQLISKYRATATVAPDFAYKLCTQLVTEAQLRELDLSSLTTAITGAEPVRWHTLYRFAARFAPAGFTEGSFMPAFGMAETTLLVSAKRSNVPVRPLYVDAGDLERGVVTPVGSGKSLTLVPCGPPAPEHHIAIVDRATWTLAEPNTVGEIWVSGPSVAQGYWNRADQTAEVFGARLPGSDRAYLRTGDLGFLAEDGIVVTGRLKDLIIIRGRNIAPSDLEIACSDLLATSAGAGAVAFEWDENAVVVVAEAAGPSTVQIENRAENARRQLADDFSLEPLSLVIVRRGGIPRTTSGKVRRAATRDRLIAGSLPVVLTVGPSVTPHTRLTRSEFFTKQVAR